MLYLLYKFINPFSTSLIYNIKKKHDTDAVIIGNVRLVYVNPHEVGPSSLIFFFYV